jgi:hypothetical protein
MESVEASPRAAVRLRAHVFSPLIPGAFQSKIGMRMPVHRDASGFPFVRIRPVGRSSDADIAENLVFFEKCFARREPFTALFDLRQAASITGTQRRMYADWFAANEVKIMRYFRGGVAVSESPFVRAAITAIFWMYRAPFPHRMTDDMAAAEAWVAEWMRRAA